MVIPEGKHFKDLYVIKERGEHGYVASVRRHSLMLAAIELIAAIAVYGVSTMIEGRIHLYIVVVSLFLLFPVAANLSHLMPFFFYHPLPEDVLEDFRKISSDFWVLEDLPLVLGKKNYFFPMIIVTSKGVYALSSSNTPLLGPHRLLKNLLKNKGYNKEIYVTQDAESLKVKLIQEVKSKAQNPNLNEVTRVISWIKNSAQ